MSIFGELLYPINDEKIDDKDLVGSIGIYNLTVTQSTESGEPVFPEFLFLITDRRGRYAGSGFYGMSETDRNPFTGNTFKKFELDSTNIARMVLRSGETRKTYALLNEREVEGNIETWYQLQR